MTRAIWLEDPAPPMLRLSLGITAATPGTQPWGARARLLEPLARSGQKVLKGQLIATGSLPLHAPTSGYIRGVVDVPDASPTGTVLPHLQLEVDGEDRPAALKPYLFADSLDVAGFIEAVRQAGICGLGGAGFPTYAKLQAAADWSARHASLVALVVNGIECEPGMSADDQLMRSKADEIIAGIELLTRLLNPNRTIIALGDSKTEAYAQLRTKLERAGCQQIVQPGCDTISEKPQLVVLAETGAMGSESRLLPTLNLPYPKGRQHNHHTTTTLPRQEYPTDAGVLCLNVTTVHAIYRAIRHGEPMLERLVSVAGDATSQRVLLAPNGLPISSLLNEPAEDVDVYLNGSLSGWRVSSASSLNKSSLGLSIRKHNPSVYPCIRCDRCRQICPAQIDPQQLHWSAKAENLSMLQVLGLDRCIECGLCDAVCPSHIPLLEQFRNQKHLARQLTQRRDAAKVAKKRFENHAKRAAQKNLADEQKRAYRLRKFTASKDSGTSTS